MISLRYQQETPKDRWFVVQLITENNYTAELDAALVKTKHFFPTLVNNAVKILNKAAQLLTTRADYKPNFALSGYQKVAMLAKQHHQFMTITQEVDHIFLTKFLYQVDFANYLLYNTISVKLVTNRVHRSNLIDLEQAWVTKRNNLLDDCFKHYIVMEME